VRRETGESASDAGGVKGSHPTPLPTNRASWTQAPRSAQVCMHWTLNIRPISASSARASRSRVLACAAPPRRALCALHRSLIVALHNHRKPTPCLERQIWRSLRTNSSAYAAAVHHLMLVHRPPDERRDSILTPLQLLTHQLQLQPLSALTPSVSGARHGVPLSTRRWACPTSQARAADSSPQHPLLLAPSSHGCRSPCVYTRLGTRLREMTRGRSQGNSLLLRLNSQGKLRMRLLLLLGHVRTAWCVCDTSRWRFLALFV
jgi:hypothetical protein